MVIRTTFCPFPSPAFAMSPVSPDSISLPAASSFFSSALVSSALLSSFFSSAVVSAVVAAAVVSFGADEQPANNAEPSAAARIIEIAFFLIILYLSFLYCESIFMLYLRLYLHFTYFLVVFMFFALASAASYDYVHKYCNNYDNTDHDISDSNRCSCKLKTIL